MRAIFCEKYGPPEVLKLREVEKPVPQENEVLVKVIATTVTIGDVFLRRGKHPDSLFFTIMLHLAFGIFKPRKSVLGMEISGIVEKTGVNVKKFNVNDEVYGSTFGIKFGGYAEYKCFPENGMLLKKPANIRFEEAATIPGGGMTALRCLKRGKLKKGQKVLIIGASGAVGTNAVQIAKYFGAHVTGVCSTANVELVKSLGADIVIDYTKNDFSQMSSYYDLIFDAVSKVPSSKAKKSLNKNGSYINVIKHSGSGEEMEELIFINELIEKGKLRPVVDKCYSMDQIIEAHKHVEKGHKRGNVVIQIEREGKPINKN